MLSWPRMRPGAQSLMRDHARLIGCCAFALLLPLLFPLATGRVFTKDDLGALHLPFRYLYSEALHAGEFLLWTPAYHSGFFLFAAGEVGMAHPLHWLFYRLLPLGPAFNLEIICSYIALFFGTGLFLQRVGGRTAGSWFGAMLFTFGGFNLFNLMHVNHIGTLAHAPWMLLATHVLMTATGRRPRALAFAGLAASTGLQLLAGNPQYVWLTGVAVAFLLVCLVIAGASWSHGALTLLGLALGGSIGAVQLWPTLEFLLDSTRMDWSREQALTFSMSPLNIVQLWAPFAFEFRVHAPPSEEFQVHEFIVYNGAFCTAALGWIALRYRQLERRAIVSALLCFAGLNLVLALGRYGGVYPLLAELPGLGHLRAPSRYIVWVQLALSAVAGLALDDLLALTRRSERIAWRRLWPLAAIVLLTVATTITGASLAGSGWASSHGLRLSGLLRSAPAAVFVIAIVGIVTLAARGRRWAVPALIVLSACDLGLWGYSYALRWGPIRSLAELRAEATAPVAAQAGDLIPTFFGGRDAYAVLKDLRLTAGYTGLNSARLLDPSEPATQRLSGLAWEGNGERWSRVTDSMPRGRLVSQARPSADPRSDLALIDMRQIALVDRPLSLSGEPGTVRWLTDRPGQLAVETSADEAQLLVVTERFHRGWQATIDGHPAEVLRVYGDFMGCVVPPGLHQVSLQFWPDSVRFGKLVTLSAVGLTAIVVAFLALRRH